MQTSLSGKTALVTGASRGIGREIALGFARSGADIAIAARTAADLEALAEEIASCGVRSHAVVADTSSVEANEQLFAEAERALGPLDILVNNAGGGGSYVEGGSESLLDSSPQAVAALFTLNVIGPMALTRLAASSMREHGGGSILNVSSRLAQSPNPAVGAYSASKAAIQSFTTSWALELGPYGIRVNAIAPGGVATANMGRIMADPQLSTSYESTVPLGRLGTPRDAANCALFLASDDAAWVSGATILVTGGRP